MDQRDRLIVALSALLRAEREALHAMEAAIAEGELSCDVLERMVCDPVSAASPEDIRLAHDFACPFTQSEDGQEHL